VGIKWTKASPVQLIAFEDCAQFWICLMLLNVSILWGERRCKTWSNPKFARLNNRHKTPSINPF